MWVLRRGDLGRLTLLLFALTGFTAGSVAGTGLNVVLTADKAAYTRSEPIVLTIAVVNRGLEPVTLQFRTAQRYDVAIHNAENVEVWRWSRGQMFAQVLGEETLAGQGRLRYRVTVRHRFPPGPYTVVATVPAEGNARSASLQIAIR
jgi:hypothetical protein